MSEPVPSQPLWAIVPTLDLVDLTLQTCDDLLAQSIPIRVLLIDQGSSEASNAVFRAYAERHHPDVVLWSFNPPLPSLSAAWNQGLAFVWELGGTHALVVNSDVRVRPDTAEILHRVCQPPYALFVSAVGVTAEQFCPDEPLIMAEDPDADQPSLSKGGPDFSCFLLSREGHDRYPFDEGFIPLYLEDVDCHRRYLLGGDGSRIFSIPLPFHHIGGGSRTINQSEGARQAFERLAGIGRAHYQAKWGGGPNQERFITPYGPQGFDGVTTPELQARVHAGAPVLSGLPLIAQDMQQAMRELSPAEAAASLEIALRQKAEALRG